jgi:hypothetical protein
MRQAKTGEVAAVCVLTAVHMDSGTRRSTAFPPEFLERGKTLMCSYDARQ